MHFDLSAAVKSLYSSIKVSLFGLATATNTTHHPKAEAKTVEFAHLSLCHVLLPFVDSVFAFAQKKNPCRRRLTTWRYVPSHGSWFAFVGAIEIYFGTETVRKSTSTKSLRFATEMPSIPTRQKIQALIYASMHGHARDIRLGSAHVKQHKQHLYTKKTFSSTPIFHTFFVASRQQTLQSCKDADGYPTPKSQTLKPDLSAFRKRDLIDK